MDGRNNTVWKLFLFTGQRLGSVQWQRRAVSVRQPLRTRRCVIHEQFLSRFELKSHFALNGGDNAVHEGRDRQQQRHLDSFSPFPRRSDERGGPGAQVLPLHDAALPAGQHRRRLAQSAHRRLQVRRRRPVLRVQGHAPRLYVTCPFLMNIFCVLAQFVGHLPHSSRTLVLWMFRTPPPLSLRGSQTIRKLGLLVLKGDCCK